MFSSDLFRLADSPPAPHHDDGPSGSASSVGSMGFDMGFVYVGPMASRAEAVKWFDSDHANPGLLHFLNNSAPDPMIRFDINDLDAVRTPPT